MTLLLVEQANHKAQRFTPHNPKPTFEKTNKVPFFFIIPNILMLSIVGEIAKLFYQQEAVQFNPSVVVYWLSILRSFNVALCWLQDWGMVLSGCGQKPQGVMELGTLPMGDWMLQEGMLKSDVTFNASSFTAQLQQLNTTMENK